MATPTKEEIIEALSKSLKDITDKELKGILEVPEMFWPTNPFNYTTKLLLDEQQRRANVNKITYEEVLRDVMWLSLLKHLVYQGPKIFPEIDLLGHDDCYAEIKKLTPIVKKKVLQYKKENNIQ
jgi:hypothetical protein